MSHQTWVAGLAPDHLAGALAGSLDHTVAGYQLSEADLHEDAEGSGDGTTLELIASRLDLHPATAAVLRARAPRLGMFTLACTLLRAGHADKLAPLLDNVGNTADVGGPGAELTSWLNAGPVDWNDLLAALEAAGPITASSIMGAYLDSDHPDGDLLDAVTAHAPHLLPNLDEHLLWVRRWDSRTAARLTGAILPALRGFDPWVDQWVGPVPCAIADDATWAALACEDGCDRLTYAIAGCGQSVPAHVVPALVALARQGRPKLMWALLRVSGRGIDWATAELAELIASHYELADLYGPGEYGRTDGGYLLTAYGHLLDEPSKATILAAAPLGTLAHWCATGVLVASDAELLYATLRMNGTDLVELLVRPEISGHEWADVRANPLLLELMMSSAAFLNLIAADDHVHHPGCAPELNAALRTWLRAQLGDDPNLWRTFAVMLADPGAASTADLVAAAKAANTTPARPGRS